MGNTHAEKISDNDVPEEEYPVMREGPVQDGGNLLRADEVPVKEARLEAPNAGIAVLGTGLDAPDLQRAKGVGEFALILKAAGGPFEQVQGVDVLDGSAVLDEPLHSNDTG